MKNNVYPCKPQFCYIKWDLIGSKLDRHVFVMLSSAHMQSCRKYCAQAHMLISWMLKLPESRVICTRVKIKSLVVLNGKSSHMNILLSIPKLLPGDDQSQISDRNMLNNWFRSVDIIYFKKYHSVKIHISLIFYRWYSVSMGCHERSECNQVLFQFVIFYNFSSGSYSAEHSVLASYFPDSSPNRMFLWHVCL